MKKIVIIIFGIFILGGLTLGGVFYWKNLRGALTPFTNPPEKIEKVLNTTGMPLKLPPGFSISIFASNLGDPRVIIPDPLGGFLVSAPKTGAVLWLNDEDSDGMAEKILVVAEGLHQPHGLAVTCASGGKTSCTLFIAETDQVASYNYDQTTRKAVNKKKILDLPTKDGGHLTRTLLLVSQNGEEKLLTSVGSSCNVCREDDWRRAAILISDLDGTHARLFGAGLRNAVFMAAHPISGKIWLTEMGRDLLGDDTPPDEINVIGSPLTSSEQNPPDFGWPICYGKNIHDDNFDKNTYFRNPCMEPFETPSYIDLPAHSAPLGIAFIPSVTEKSFSKSNGQKQEWPEEYWHNALVAYHGSWNRTTPTGYKIVRMKLAADGSYHGTEDFITGWLTPEGVYGRPVDILVEPGGVMYITDDKAGVVYRVIYHADASLTLAENHIYVVNPKPNDYIQSPLMLEGKARGNWFFEATFPIQLLDQNGTLIAETHAEALGNWMTTDFVSFRAILTFKKPADSLRGTIIFKKDNPSGLSQNDDEIRATVNFGK